MDIIKVKSISDKLSKYTFDNTTDKYIEITEWQNGEGYNISIGEREVISLSMGELEAINYLTKCLDYDTEK